MSDINSAPLSSSSRKARKHALPSTYSGRAKRQKTDDYELALSVVRNTTRQELEEFVIASFSPTEILSKFEEKAKTQAIFTGKHTVEVSTLEIPANADLGSFNGLVEPLMMFIFSFLNTRDRVKIGRVCKNFLSIQNDAEFSNTFYREITVGGSTGVQVSSQSLQNGALLKGLPFNQCKNLTLHHGYAGYKNEFNITSVKTFLKHLNNSGVQPTTLNIFGFKKKGIFDALANTNLFNSVEFLQVGVGNQISREAVARIFQQCTNLTSLILHSSTYLNIREIARILREARNGIPILKTFSVKPGWFDVVPSPSDFSDIPILLPELTVVDIRVQDCVYEEFGVADHNEVDLAQLNASNVSRIQELRIGYQYKTHGDLPKITNRINDKISSFIRLIDFVCPQLKKLEFKALNRRYFTCRDKKKWPRGFIPEQPSIGEVFNPTSFKCLEQLVLTGVHITEGILEHMNLDNMRCVELPEDEKAVLNLLKEKKPGIETKVNLSSREYWAQEYWGF